MMEEDRMNRTELPFRTVSELSRLIRARTVSPIEVTEAYLDRVQELNPKLNAYVTVAWNQAREAAREAERTIARGEYLGPMHGIPIAVKDQIWTRGIWTTNGSKLLKNSVPHDDATVVVKLKSAGAVLMGKLNTTEFASGGLFDHPYGVPRNPWNLDHQPGGSSNGSGVATAAFLCATSLGEDTGGSLRFPSALCNLVGLRPTWGRVSRYGVYSVNWSMDTVGPMSRTSEDCAITLAAIAGHDPKDGYTTPIPVPDYRKALDGDLRNLRIGVIRELTDHKNVLPEVKRATLSAIAMLNKLGASVEEVSLPLAPYSYLIMSVLNQVQMSSTYSEWIRDNLNDFNFDLQVKFLAGNLIPAQVYYKASRLRHLVRQQIMQALEKFDVLATPTSTTPAPRIQPGTMPTGKEEWIRRLLSPIAMTEPFSLAGLPAVSVPCGFTEEAGLPMGIQIVGRPFAEELVLKVAHAYEKVTPWHSRRPLAV
jgi:aspartyl-tRNA(Asn)/glutamyl-tRNA(Gln) amidotransferase subunit A